MKLFQALGRSTLKFLIGKGSCDASTGMSFKNNDFYIKSFVHQLLETEAYGPVEIKPYYILSEKFVRFSEKHEIMFCKNSLFIFSAYEKFRLFYLGVTDGSLGGQQH